MHGKGVTVWPDGRSYNGEQKNFHLYFSDMRMTKSMGTGHLCGLMGESTLEIGRKGNNTGRELLLNQMDRVVMVNGLMGEELNGWMKVQKERTNDMIYYIYINHINLLCTIVKFIANNKKLLYQNKFYFNRVGNDFS